MVNQQVESLNIKLSSKVLFPAFPTIHFRSSQTNCSCGKRLLVKKSWNKRVATCDIGEFLAQETILYCKACAINFYSDELRQLTPHHCRFGFDIIVYVGNTLYLEKCADIEIQRSLDAKNIPISLREIAYLGKKYMTYLAIAHDESREKIKAHLDYQGGYILHLDGTCEGDSPHLFSSMDELSGIVLHNVKMPTENKKYIIPFLEKIKASYGIPITIVSDMSNSIMDALSKAFPDVNCLICHFHFLRDLGKDLFQLEYRNITRFLQKFKVRNILRKCIRDLKALIDEDENLNQCLTDYLSRNDLEVHYSDLPTIITSYILLTWVIEARAESNGYGFPFDRPHVDLYHRLKQAYPKLQALNDKLKREKLFSLPIKAISKAINDAALKNNFNLLEEKIIVFDQLRTLMRIAQVDEKNGLNDEGDSDVQTIESQVKAFRDSEIINQLVITHFSYKKFIKQLDKYWEKLFADPIKITSSSGEVKWVFPQRTNNLMEQLFRFTKKNARKKSGTKSVYKQIKSMHPQIPLIKNLNNPEYLKIILNGKEKLAERFEVIDVKLVQEEMKKEHEVARKYHKGMARIFKISQLPDKLFNKPSKPRLAA